VNTDASTPRHTPSSHEPATVGADHLDAVLWRQLLLARLAEWLADVALTAISMETETVDEAG